MPKQVNIRLDEELSKALEQRAQSANMSPTDYVRALIADDADEQRNRFLAAADFHMKRLTDAFQEVFGSYPAGDRKGKAA
ncbi:hypothetical protein [Streptomyces boninensis]|uniref:hypothetical protein n=1 Tax=Streptomyces boninensis TaxID=2039455 RepID=UPI003B21D706